MSSNIIVEICTDNWKDTVNAIRLGADRIELCSDLDNDGLTPTDDLFERVHLFATEHGVVVFPMIRCRSGNFVYSVEEKNCMIGDAKKFARKKASGLVIGALTSDGHVDIPFIREIALAVKEENPLIEITFHKAIDNAVVPAGKSLGDIVSALEPYCHRVLTSGQRPTALEGSGAIRSIVSRNARPYVLAAGKIRETNVQEVIEELRVSEVHSRSPLIAVALKKPVRDI
jgi:copper homeostasis protein